MSSYDPAAAVAYARSQLGKRYVWGTHGPFTYDCSGLTMEACARGGLLLPHNAAQQAEQLDAVPVQRGSFQRRNLRVGDLVFYYTPISHCAIVTWVGRGGWRSRVVAATNPQRGVEDLRLFEYASPTAYAFLGRT